MTGQAELYLVFKEHYVVLDKKFKLRISIFTIIIK